MPDETIRITLRMPKWLWARIRRIADESTPRKTLQALITESVQRHLKITEVDRQKL